MKGSVPLRAVIPDYDTEPHGYTLAFDTNANASESFSDSRIAVIDGQEYELTPVKKGGTLRALVTKKMMITVDSVCLV